jgi:diaminohydroxyphosphoribosylaminopyrimidine deaminase/5-amino-6-(5-phosphoribosylamino)uracil reductase
VEGGSATWQSFIDANLWDEITTETNPDIFVKDGVESPRFSAPLFKKEVVDGNTISWFKNTNHDASVSYTN